MEGGCFCGAVRYRLDADTFDTGWCHCRICQRVSGAPALVYTTVPRPSFVITRDDGLATIHTTSFGERRFCARCGTHIAMTVAHEPDMIDVTVASLDAPERVAPGFHIFWADKIAWFNPGDNLPRHKASRSGDPTPPEQGAA